MHHFECHESVIDKEGMPAYYRQVRKYTADAPQTGYSESIVEQTRYVRLKYVDNDCIETTSR